MKIVKAIVIMFGIHSSAFAQLNEPSTAREDVSVRPLSSSNYSPASKSSRKAFTERLRIVKGSGVNVTTGNAANTGVLFGLSESGDTQFVAEYKRNKLKGEWMSWYANDQLCDSGILKNNIPDGVWKSWYPNGNLRTYRSYDSYKLEKARKDIRMRQSKAVHAPLVTIARKDPDHAYSYLHSSYSFASVNGRTQAPPNQTNTINERVSNNVSLEAGYHPPFSESFHHGLYMNFYENGAVKDSGHYVNGLRNGIWEEWHDDGKLRSVGFYEHGQKKDSWKYYNLQGQLVRISVFNKHGHLVRHKNFK